MQCVTVSFTGITMQQIFLLFYILNVEYPAIKKRSDCFLFVQKVLFELDNEKNQCALRS